MVTIDSCISSSTSLSYGSIGVNMSLEVTEISSLNGVITNGCDLGRGHLTLINFLFKFKVYTKVSIFRKAQRRNHFIHFGTRSRSTDN
ncbi:hypothetical protein TNCV_1678231 [Trichonephila clavipes]|nr:hypothetical protein TNCV_1678231 [Trichonephila clavipes]